MLGSDSILTRSSGYTLAASDTDVDEFERLTRLAAEQDPHEAVLILEQALALWRGRAFEDFEYEEWAQLEIARLEELRLAAVEQRIEAELQLGRHALLVPQLETLVANYAMREQLRGQLMVALYRSGRHADALEVYRRGRQALRDQLGLEPSPFLAELERRILAHDPKLAAPAHTRRFVDQRPRRRWLVVGAAAAAISAAAIVVALGGGASHRLLPNSVVRVDPRTLKASEVAQVGDAPDLVITSGGYLWVTNDILRDTASSAIRNNGDHTLVRVDPATGKTVVVGGGLSPCGIGADPSGDVWVANCFTKGSGHASNIIRVDATTLAFKATWVLPASQSFYRGVAYGGGFLWVSDPSGDIVRRIDPQTGGQEPITLAASAGALGWSDGYGDLWITDFPQGTVSRLHAATGTTATIGHVGINPASIVVDGNVGWVADWGAPQVVRFDATGVVRSRSIPLPTRAASRPSYVWNLAVGAGAVWAAFPRDKALWRIDPNTDAVTRIGLPYAPTGVAADANDVWVTVRK